MSLRSSSSSPCADAARRGAGPSGLCCRRAHGPDGRGIRFGLKTGFNINRLVAGERLYIDLLPLSWQGLPPSLPPGHRQLGERAKQAAILAEQKRKEMEAMELQPVATLRVSRNPTFLRIQFDWSHDTEAKLAFGDDKGDLVFDWPVPIDLYELKSDIPPQVLGVENVVDRSGSHVKLRVARDVVPRFYATSKRQFILDIDLDPETGMAAALAAEAKEEARKAEVQAQLRAAEEAQRAAAAEQPAAPGGEPRPVKPFASVIGNTVRVTFPFDEDTAAAVFRRGDTVWMLFDTHTPIAEPDPSEALAAISSGFEVLPTGDTTVVRLDLSSERLATLGSEGRSWVLSLGDVLLNVTEPIVLTRDRDARGTCMIADLAKPARVHEFRDPLVGDVLRVVTAFPPARGAARRQQYVDFAMLNSVHGLVIKPENAELQLGVDGTHAILQSPSGLMLSARDGARPLATGRARNPRLFIDLATGRETIRAGSSTSARR